MGRVTLLPLNEGLITIVNNGVYKNIMEKHRIPPAIEIIDV